MSKQANAEPAKIFDEYKRIEEYKNSLGSLGLYEQSKRNERFFVGDQWHGCKAKNYKPLVTNNVIKRIGDYKLSIISASPVSVHYSAEGVNDVQKDGDDERDIVKQSLMSGEIPPQEPQESEISVITEALSDYFRITAERTKFESLKEQLSLNAYISGTGILYSYWDSKIETGLYADNAHQAPIKGDIAIEVLNVENVCFGDPNNESIQDQPYIIISQRLDVEAVKAEAKANGIPTDEIEKIVPDNAESYNAGERGTSETTENRRVTVLTRFYKEYGENDSFVIKAVKVVKNAFIRKEWALNIKLYPFSAFRWERRKSSAYGDSEITYLIPNQIAINRALTASVWGIMSSGMPIMVVNGDVVTDHITNEPGQIIKLYGTAEEASSAVRYVNPPQFAGGIQSFVDGLVKSTLQASGASDAALGDMKPDNATAIIQIREAALAPMQIYQNRFYDFIEDTARIWAEMWVNYYGDRQILIEDKSGRHYIPFKAERYKSLVLTARIDVGSATLWSDAVTIGTLDNLLQSQQITFLQYLERLPKGLIPDISGLILDITRQQALAEQQSGQQELMGNFAQQHPQEYMDYMQMLPEDQQKVMNMVGESR